MIKSICISIFIFIITGQAFAHEDFFVVKDFGNVKVRFKTGFV